MRWWCSCDVYQYYATLQGYLGVAVVIINVSGHALRILDDFIYYASIYPGRIANSIWWCEDTFTCGIAQLKKAFDEAFSEESRNNYYERGG